MPQASEVTELKFCSLEDMPEEMKPVNKDFFKRVTEYLKK